MASEWSSELKQWIGERAVEAGFDRCGVVGIEMEEASGALDGKRFADWVERGRAGEMEYLKRRNEAGEFLRSGVKAAIPWAQSVVVCALNYNAAGPLSIEPAAAGTGWIGRYAWSGKAIEGGMARADYHEDLLGRLRRMEAALLSRLQCETRCYVDTGPLVERSLAAHAGIGWIGKNTCVLNQELGSWLLLGVIVTSLPVNDDAVAVIAADRCGSCTRCIDACPTDALVGEREMDASRCIAYLTIEKKEAIAEELREPIGRQVFGCDICQDVCPWNRRSPIVRREGMLPRPELINPALEWLARMDAKEFKQRFKGSPLERTTRKRLLRNVAIAMGKAVPSREREFLPQVAGVDVQGEDAVLAETAGWALRGELNWNEMRLLPEYRLESARRLLRLQ